jgi:SAM-dependent methyltransferase
MQALKSLCAICNETTPVSLLYDKDSLRIIRCRHCHTLFRPKEEHGESKPVDNAPEYYSESMRCLTGNRLFFRLTFEHLMTKFPRIRGGNLLDVGCGIGNSLFAAKALGFHTYGIEISRWASDYCRKEGFEIFTSLEELSRRDLKFDVINLGHVLEHVTDPISFLASLKEFLKEDGMIRMEVPDCGNFSFWRLFSWSKYVVSKPLADHLYYFTLPTLRNVVLKSGLAVIDIHREGFGDYARHRATMFNKNMFVKMISNLFYYSRIERLCNLYTFLVAIAGKKP